MKHAILAALAAIAAGAAMAQGIRDTDTILNADETQAALAGHVIEFFDGSKARYDAGGAYSYTYSGDTEPFRGTYVPGAGGEVCVTFDNGFSRCDVYVRDGERLVLIIADGTRFPVRTRTPLAP